MFDIPAVDDPRIMVPIPVPVKGRKTPLVLKLPRLDFLGEDQFDAMTEALEAINQMTDVAQRKLTRMSHLAMLKPALTPADLKVCDALTSGQLGMVIGIWTEQSNISLGEFLASADSSPGNTEAHSDSTSTPEGGLEETSDAA